MAVSVGAAMSSRHWPWRPRGDDRAGLPVGLAASGQAGVENVLDIMRGGIDSALMGLGKKSVHELSPDDL